MKSVQLTFMAATILALFSASSHAQTITSQGELPGLSTMPGSETDFSFYGNPQNFPGDQYYRGDGEAGSGTQGALLADFTESQGNFEYIDGGESANFSTINSPLPGLTYLTGAFFGGNPNPAYGQNTEFDAVNYSLLSSPDFTYSNFNVYVMFSNNPGQSGYNDSAITLTLLSSSGSVLDVQNVDDSNSGFHPSTTSTSIADFAKFNVQGAATGDTLEIGYVGGNGRYGYLGGVSFESVVPEPSTYAMMFAGFGLLAFCVRRKLA